MVKYSANTTHPYWIARVSHTNQTPPASGNTATTYWETFGATFTSVATGLLLAEESVVQNTINVGFSPVGNSNIAIVGGTESPYIAIGQSTQGYNNNGVFLGVNVSSISDAKTVSSIGSTTPILVSPTTGNKYIYLPGIAFLLSLGQTVSIYNQNSAMTGTVNYSNSGVYPNHIGINVTSVEGFVPYNT